LRLRYFRYSYNLDPQHGQRRRRRRRSVGGLRSYDRSLRFASLPDADSLLTRAQIGRSEVDRPTINYSRDKGLETLAARCGGAAARRAIAVNSSCMTDCWTQAGRRPATRTTAMIECGGGAPRPSWARAAMKF